MRFYLFPSKAQDLNKEGLKLLAMWFLVFLPFMIFCMWLAFNHRLALAEWFVFAALWLPIRWSNPNMKIH